VWGSADALIAISHGLGAYLAADVGVPRDRITVVPYGLPADERPSGTSLRRELGLGRRERLLLSVGRLVPQKGHAYLLDAMPEILRRVPDCHAAIVGHAQSAYGRLLRARVAARGLATRVHVVGYRDVGTAALAEADVFVFPSLWEGFGLAVVEAMAAGVPVVCTDTGPLPEVVGHGECGILVPPRDATALAAAVVRVLESPALAARLGEAGRRRAAARYGIDGMIAATAALYAPLLGGAPS
jgi:glycosyltransferase involved in cell wall biosynthesis